MLRSMYTSVSGLRNHQTMLDVVANNIANVNTTGYKASRVGFKDLLSQLQQGASAPSGGLGGTNNMQVGLGMQLGSITQVHTMGSIANTGVQTDLAINGDGFFRVTNDGAGIAGGTANIVYQRSGEFDRDAAGNLVTKDGYYVVGYADDGAGAPDPATPTIINIPPGSASFSIGTDGSVTVISGAGVSSTAGWITTSVFSNPAGLTQIGNNKWESSNNSGAPQDGTPGDPATGSAFIMAGALEFSNVDLAFEFTEMIRAQRGFQANARTITTSDEILQELVNLKR